MTWTAVGSFYDVSTTSLAVTNTTVGNLLLIEVQNGANATVSCTGLTGGGATFTKIGTLLTGSTVTQTAVIFAGRITATGAQTITATWSGTTPSTYELAGHEFHSSVGSWTIDKQGNLDNSGGTNNWPSLTPGYSGELYFGFCGDTGSAVGGATSGYVYNVPATGDASAYNLSCPAGVATFPVFTDGGSNFGICVLMRETPAVFARSQEVRARLPRGPYVLGNPGLIYQVSRDGTP